MLSHPERALARLLEEALICAMDRTVEGDELPVLWGEGWQASARSLRAQSHRIARSLTALALQANTPIILRVSNRAEDFAVMLGLWLAKLVAVPVHRTSPQAVLDAVCQKVAAPYVIDWRFDQRDAEEPMHDWLYPTSVEPRSLDASEKALLEDAALIVMTSGSTGLPKGVVLRHEAFAGKLAAIQSMLRVTSEDRVLLVLNNSFSFGLWMSFLGLMHARDVVLSERFDPAAFFSSLLDKQITLSAVVPTMMRSLAAHFSPEQLLEQSHQLSLKGKLAQLVIGGESLGTQLSADLRQWIAPARLIDIYGLTESCTCDFFLMPEDYPAHPDSIGQAAPGVCFRIVDEQGLPCAPLQVGELTIKSAFLMSGYLGDEALSAASLNDGWLRTGDLAQADEDGFVYLKGRSKELISRGGNKVTPQEVELALCRCEAVAAALVTGIDDPLMGERIAALLIPKPGFSIDEKALRLELGRFLERYKHPDVIRIGHELPQGRTGKIDRGLLRKQMIENQK